ncbi:uncharacterized protein (DUF488 family) [Mycobacterium sp. OAS707]|uniref:DUF488 domain-containing protein n=1 Tax=Mycobacterium sp. OAS707 TaxID=2663822 RepID=UPI00178BA349|nr:DUF488 domain-containing protein [Mycobacterium sp. OAS707]MBE1551144.1 uncharacterized protein (DUF488 family) [Mycobacterium sp. OAS707]
MTTVMTIGYQNRTVDDVVAMLRSADVKVLVDVRLTPLSRKAGLSKNGLAARLHDVGIDYVHLPQLGNPRDNRGAFRRGVQAAVARYREELRTPEGQAALGELFRLASQIRVALMCFEANAAECHRSMVADALDEIGSVQTIHL